MRSQEVFCQYKTVVKDIVVDRREKSGWIKVFAM